MPYSPRPSGGSSISNAGGTVSIDGDGAVHVTPADGQNTNIGGGALAISAPLEDANTAVFKAVDGHTFYTGALGSEVLIATIGPDGITGTPISGSTGAFTTLQLNGIGFQADYGGLIVGGNGALLAGGRLIIPRIEFCPFSIFDAASTTLVPGSNTLALRNGTAGQTLLLSRSYTDASNYSQLKIDVTGSTVAFSADEAGTGVGTLTGYSFDRTVATPILRAPNFVITPQIASNDGGGLLLTNDSGNPANLQMGGRTASYPALKRTGSDIEIVKADGTAVDTAIILSSPNGTRYRVTVSNAGTITATAA